MVNKLFILLILIICILLTGCGTTTRVEVQEVYIPVKMELLTDIPIRPAIEENEKYASYLVRILEYTEQLEVILNNIYNTPF